LAESGRHVGRVVARVLKRCGVLVGGIADDEGDAFLGGCRSECTEEQEDNG
jgi:hypothetical protein